jgi:hypothetical protein
MLKAEFSAKVYLRRGGQPPKRGNMATIKPRPYDTRASRMYRKARVSRRFEGGHGIRWNRDGRTCYACGQKQYASLHGQGGQP